MPSETGTPASSGQLEAILAASGFDSMLDALCSASTVTRPDTPSQNARNAKEIEVVAIVKSLVELIRQQDAELKSLKAKVATLESPSSHSAEPFPPLFASIVQKNVKLTPTETNVLNAVTHESIEQQKRSQNVMVYGVAESTRTTVEERRTEDKTKVEEIFNHIEIDVSAIKEVHRLRSNVASKPGPIVVKLKENAQGQMVVQRSSILRAAKSLSKDNSQFKHVFIGPDLTPAQRERRRQLVQECARLNQPLRGQNGALNGSHCFVIRDDRVVKVARSNTN